MAYKVKFEERHGQVHLLFAFDVIESPIKKLVDSTDFKNYIGDLLLDFISSNVDMEIQDETGTDDTEKLNIQ